MAKNTNDPPSFEQTLGRLEEIVRLLEDGKIGLDEALGRYEEGVGLLRQAHDLLQRAERRIAILSGFDSAGNPVLQNVDDAATFSLEKEVASLESPAKRRSRRSAESEAP